MEHRQMNKLDREIDEMEKALTGTTEEDDSTPEKQEEVATASEEKHSPEESEEKSPDTSLSNEDQNAEAKTEVVKQDKPEPKKKETSDIDWKDRYSSLRSHHDGLVYELRSEVASLKEQLVSATKTINKLQEAQVAAPKANTDYSDILSEEEKEVLGPEAVAALNKMTQKAMESAVNPLKDQLNEEKQRRLSNEEREAKDSRVKAQQIFLHRLGQLVPDYQEIDKDPNFVKWCDGLDIYSGVPRKVLFRRAESTGDVSRVAEFFVQYRNETQKKTASDPLEEHVNPTGEGSAETAAKNKDGKKVWSMAQVDKFYDDVAKGRYRGRQKLVEQIEADIDAAVAEGRLK